MNGAPAPEEYYLLQDEIIERLKDREWFIRCIGRNYQQLAARWGCRVHMSVRRLGEAHDFWLEDVDRVLKVGIQAGTTDLDHFKHASFIAFWLRRMIPVNDTNREPQSVMARTATSAEQSKFFRYGNELCALLIGFQLCLFYESSKALEKDGKIVPVVPDRMAYIKEINFPEGLRDDFAMVLKHKNISPHSLYLLYKSLFANIVPAR